MSGDRLSYGNQLDLLEVTWMLKCRVICAVHNGSQCSERLRAPSVRLAHSLGSRAWVVAARLDAAAAEACFQAF